MIKWLNVKTKIGMFFLLWFKKCFASFICFLLPFAWVDLIHYHEKYQIQMPEYWRFCSWSCRPNFLVFWWKMFLLYFLRDGSSSKLWINWLNVGQSFQQKIYKLISESTWITVGVCRAWTSMSYNQSNLSWIRTLLKNENKNCSQWFFF